MNRFSAAIGAAAGLSLLFFGCTKGGQVSGGSASAGDRIQIFYNNDNFGYLEPCGCRVSPIGGIDRRWNAFMAYPEESRLYVDAGNMLFKATEAAEHLAPQWYEQAVGVVEGYNLLGAAAATVGETDFALGLVPFEQLMKVAKFPYVSANIYRAESGERFLPESVVVERKGKKIGIFGVFHPSLKLPPELEARDPVAAGKAAVSGLRAKGVDMIIALSHQGYDNDVKFAHAVPGIDLIVGANSQSLLQEPDLEGKTLIVQLSNQGQMLGMVEYKASNLPQERTGFTVAELNADYNDAPRGLANPMKNLLAVTNLRMLEANRKLDEKIWAAHQAKGAAGYETFLSCRDCHGKQVKFQEGHPHAASFLTLVQAKKERNLDCVKCHSVGMGEPGGFKTLNDAFLADDGTPISYAKVKAAMPKDFPPEGVSYRANRAKIRPDVERWIASLKKADVKKAFVSVQCENCHGSKVGHPFGGEPSAKVAGELCLQCHTKEQAPAWYDPAGKLKPAQLKAAMKEVACPR